MTARPIPGVQPPAPDEVRNRAAGAHRPKAGHPAPEQSADHFAYASSDMTHRAHR